MQFDNSIIISRPCRYLKIRDQESPKMFPRCCQVRCPCWGEARYEYQHISTIPCGLKILQRMAEVKQTAFYSSWMTSPLRPPTGFSGCRKRVQGALWILKFIQARIECKTRVASETKQRWAMIPTIILPCILPSEIQYKPLLNCKDCTPSM